MRRCQWACRTLTGVIRRFGEVAVRFQKVDRLEYQVLAFREDPQEQHAVASPHLVLLDALDLFLAQGIDELQYPLLFGDNVVQRIIIA